MNYFINNIFGRITGKAGHVLDHDKKATLFSREIKTAVRLMLTWGIAKDGVSEETMVVTENCSDYVIVSGSG